MATVIPRATRSVFNECPSSQISRCFVQARSSSPRNTPSIRQISRSFTSSHQYAATPATSLVRKTNDPAKPFPPPKSEPAIDEQSSITDMTGGLADEPLILDEGSRQVDWTKSFHGLSAEPFSKEAADVLLAPIAPDDVEVKPDGIIYLPEIKYRRILNKAFGPGGWGMAPRGETIVTGKSITREYALLAHGRCVCPSSHKVALVLILFAVTG